MGGQDKGLVELAPQTPMIRYVLDVLAPQVGTVMINANRNLEEYGRLGWPVVTDETGDFQGPLAGIAACLNRCSTPYLLTVPCDGPLLARELAGRLYLSLTDSNADIAAASDGVRLQPVFALMKRTLLSSLLDFLAGGERKIDLWYGRHALAVADFSDRPDTFLTVNTPEDLELLKARMSRDEPRR